MTEDDIGLLKALKEKVLDKVAHIKRRTARAGLLGKYILLRSSTWKDTKDLMEERGYPGGRMTRVHILDLDTHITFKMKKDGKLINTDFLDAFMRTAPDFEISVAHFKDLFYIRVGHKPGYHKGNRILYDYSPILAWAHDDIRVHGSPNAPNEVRGAASIFIKFIERVPINHLALICDMTGPELTELGLREVAEELGLVKEGDVDG